MEGFQTAMVLVPLNITVSKQSEYSLNDFRLSISNNYSLESRLFLFDALIKLLTLSFQVSQFLSDLAFNKRVTFLFKLQ